MSVCHYYTSTKLTCFQTNKYIQIFTSFISDPIIHKIPNIKNTVHLSLQATNFFLCRVRLELYRQCWMEGSFLHSSSAIGEHPEKKLLLLLHSAFFFFFRMDAWFSCASAGRGAPRLGLRCSFMESTWPMSLISRRTFLVGVTQGGVKNELPAVTSPV